MHVCMYVCLYVFMFIYIYIYIYIYACTYVCIYVYVAGFTWVYVACVYNIENNKEILEILALAVLLLSSK